MAFSRKLSLLLVVVAAAEETAEPRLLIDLLQSAPAAQPRMLSNFLPSYQSSVVADSSNPSMGMGGFGGQNMPVMMTDPAQQQQYQRASEESSLIVEGCVKAFLNKSNLEQGEMDCLVQGSGDLAGNIMMVSEHAVALMKQMTHQQDQSTPSPAQGGVAGPGQAPYSDPVAQRFAQMQQQMASQSKQMQDMLQKIKDDNGAGTPEKADLSLFYNGRRMQGRQLQMINAAGFAVEASSVMMELGLSVKQIISLMKDIVHKCVKQDAMEDFRVAEEHLKSMSYMGSRVMANGADIVAELAEVVLSWDNKDYRGFGTNIGLVMRKVLLSNSTNADLPDGLKGAQTLAGITTQFVKGFFGPGMDLSIKTPETKRAIDIDLHECIGKNLKFFQTMWSAPLIFYEKEKEEKQQDLADGVISNKEEMQDRKEKVRFGTALAFSMMQFPRAMRQCHISPEQEQALMDAIKALGSGTKINFDAGDDPHVSKDEVAGSMAETLKDYGDGNWNSFGQNLGQLLQQAVERVFQQKYYVDADGNLRKQLMQASADFKGNLRSQGGVPLLAPVLLVLAVVMLPILALRAHRNLAASERTRDLNAVAEEHEFARTSHAEDNLEDGVE